MKAAGRAGILYAAANGDAALQTAIYNLTTAVNNKNTTQDNAIAAVKTNADNAIAALTWGSF